MNELNSYSFFCLFCSLFFVSHFFFYPMGDIRIGSLNINGARADGKRASLFKLCSLNKLDVILVQRHTVLLITRLTGGQSGLLKPSSVTNQ